MGDLTDYLTAHFGWLTKASPSLKKLLNDQQRIQLESLRKEFQIPHDNFLMCIYMSIQLGSKIVERDYFLHKKLWPYKTEKEILENLLADDFSKDLEMANSSPKEMEQLINQAMKQINTFAQLHYYIILRTHSSNPEYYNSTLAQRIDMIIGGQNAIQSIRCPKCSSNLKIPYPYVSFVRTCGACGESFRVPNLFESETEQRHRQEENQFEWHDTDPAINLSERILCGDGACTGVVNEKRFCGTCGKPYTGFSFFILMFLSIITI